MSQAPAAAASGGGAPAPAAALERFVGQGIAAQVAVEQVLAQHPPATVIKVQVPTPGRIVLYCPMSGPAVERPAIVLSRHPENPLDVELLVFDPRGGVHTWANHAGRDLQVRPGRWRWPTFSSETVEL